MMMMMMILMTILGGVKGRDPLKKVVFFRALPELAMNDNDDCNDNYDSHDP